MTFLKSGQVKQKKKSDHKSKGTKVAANSLISNLQQTEPKFCKNHQNKRNIQQKEQKSLTKRSQQEDNTAEELIHINQQPALYITPTLLTKIENKDLPDVFANYFENKVKNIVNKVNMDQTVFNGRKRWNLYKLI